VPEAAEYTAMPTPSVRLITVAGAPCVGIDELDAGRVQNTNAPNYRFFSIASAVCATS
jgi:hypothetical protein